jgi:hypothetical protein
LPKKQRRSSDSTASGVISSRLSMTRWPGPSFGRQRRLQREYVTVAP